MNRLYMIVTADRYELPMLVADSLDELSEFSGKTKTNISSCISKKKNGKNNGYKFIRIEVDDA